MTNSITLFKQFVPLLDEVYKEASKTAVLDGRPELVQAGANANELVIPKMTMDGLADYSRNGGYVGGGMSLTNETVTCNFDRGRMFVVDHMDNADTAGVAFGMLAGIGIGLATQMAFSLWRSHRHSLQLARYDDHYVLRIQQNLTFMHNPHLLALLAKIPEKSVVIVEHDSVGYLDPDVRAVLDDFAENAPQRGIRLNQWPLASR